MALTLAEGRKPGSGRPKNPETIMREQFEARVPIGRVESSNIFLPNLSGVKDDARREKRTYNLPLIDGTDGQVLTTDGSGSVTWEDATGGTATEVELNNVVQGRLTLESGVPISNSDQIDKTTIYFTPYQGNSISLYNTSTSKWVVTDFAEVSIALSSLTSGKNYDIFIYDNSGTVTLEIGTAWTNDTTRAEALATQDAIYVKTSAANKRYLGTFRSTATDKTEDSQGGATTQVGGKRFLWNYYNRVMRHMEVKDTTDSWSGAAASGSWTYANNASANKVEYVIGITKESQIDCMVHGVTFIGGNSSYAAKVACGYDTDSAPSGKVQGGYFNGAGALYAPLFGRYIIRSTLGYHFMAWIESKADGSTCLFLGDNGGDGQLAGILATIDN
jgi:hypothetical protein